MMILQTSFLAFLAVFQAHQALAAHIDTADTVEDTGDGKVLYLILDGQGGDGGGRNLRSLSDPPPSFMFDLNNDATNICPVASGGVCNDDYYCFDEGTDWDLSFSNPSFQEICRLDITFFSSSCFPGQDAGVEEVPIAVNGFSLGSVSGWVNACLCGGCDQNSISTTDSTILDSLGSFGAGSTLSFDIVGGDTSKVCTDKIQLDFHTNCDSFSTGDPHFKTWSGEHFEYHGQCDMVLAKDLNFAHGLGLEVQIRTKLVRFWSYIKQAVIRIGDDILEVEGSGEPSMKTRYWINLDFQGDISSLGGFPVTNRVQSDIKHFMEIDLSSKFPNQKIRISTFKEFVRVDFLYGTNESFGNTVGLLGDFQTGKTLARDGTTVLDDFSELGREWQVLPSEDMLFHDVSKPQFPQKCIEPEDPRGERRRRLEESTVTLEQVRAACAFLQDELDQKDCEYDVLATQDLEMAGAWAA
jgi:hypothetical protein